MDTATVSKDRNIELIRCLSGAIHDGGYGMQEVPSIFIKVMTTGNWQDFIDDLGRRVCPVDFKTFVETRYPSGLGTTLEVLERLIEHDDAAMDIFRVVAKGKVGGDRQTEKGKSIRYIITNAIKRGTSAGYGRERLGREAPELLKRVDAGELSVNAAMIQAGFREKTITVVLKPEKVAEAIKKHFTPEEIGCIVKALQSIQGGL